MDENKAQAFVGKVLGDTGGLTITAMAALGDRLGIWKELAANGPANSVELAKRLGMSERHLREWLSAMTAAGYLEHDAGSRRFTLPPEHAPVLAQESGPVFFGGVYEALLGFLKPLDRIAETFRGGGGVPQSAYPESAYNGIDRFTACWYENLLVQSWIPAADGIAARLEAGIDVADVGCGRGRALIKLAQAFPRSRFVGYDVYGPSIAAARAAAARAGVADRVRFVEANASEGIPGRFDLVTTFDVVHDAVDPLALVRSIQRALEPGGTYLCLEMNCSHRLEENAGPIGAFFYGCSLLYCMPTSLAYDGAGLGTCGVHEPKLRELAAAAGFTDVVKLPIDNPFNNLYALK